MKSTTRHVLPDRETTSDVDEYCAKWRGVAKPLCKALNARLLGFDPGILLLLPGEKTLSFDTSTVLLLNKAIER